MIQNAKFSGYYFYMHANIWRDFQICISVPLTSTRNVLGKDWSCVEWFKEIVNSHGRTLKFCNQWSSCTQHRLWQWFHYIQNENDFAKQKQKRITLEFHIIKSTNILSWKSVEDANDTINERILIC